MRVTLRTPIIAGVLSFFALCAPLLVQSSERKDVAASAQPVSAEQPVGAAGMVVFRDPESGALVDRPVTAEQRAAVALPARPDTPVQMIVHANGTKQFVLGPETYVSMSAERTEGGVVTTCSEGESADKHAAHATTSRGVK